jgi:hypothetical protein
MVSSCWDSPTRRDARLANQNEELVGTARNHGFQAFRDGRKKLQSTAGASRDFSHEAEPIALSACLRYYRRESRHVAEMAPAGFAASVAAGRMTLPVELQQDWAVLKEWTGEPGNTDTEFAGERPHKGERQRVRNVHCQEQARRVLSRNPQHREGLAGDCRAAEGMRSEPLIVSQVTAARRFRETSSLRRRLDCRDRDSTRDLSSAS